MRDRIFAVLDVSRLVLVVLSVAVLALALVVLSGCERASDALDDPGESAPACDPPDLTGCEGYTPPDARGRETCDDGRMVTTQAGLPYGYRTAAGATWCWPDGDAMMVAACPPDDLECVTAEFRCYGQAGAPAACADVRQAHADAWAGVSDG